MLNRKQINSNTIQFEDFANSSQANNIGDAVEVNAGGPWSANRYVIATKSYVVGDTSKVVMTARKIESYKGYELNVVEGSVKKCSKVVAYIVEDEAAGLYYVGENLDDVNNKHYGCSESLVEACKIWDNFSK